MSSLKLLSGGAAQGLVASIEPQFKAMTGLDIEGEFGAVGVMADKLLTGTPADLMVLTSALIAELAHQHLVLSASIADIGVVETAIAVRAGDALVSVKDAIELRDAFMAADAIYVPDIKASTAGIHIAKVLKQLGIADAVADRLKIYPNGATAMRHLAASDAVRPMGCTQATEILGTAGVVLSGSLPPGCELSTVYTAAITTKASDTKAAQRLVDLLIGSDQLELRQRAGFLEIPI